MNQVLAQKKILITLTPGSLFQLTVIITDVEINQDEHVSPKIDQI